MKNKSKMKVDKINLALFYSARFEAFRKGHSEKIYTKSLSRIYSQVPTIRKKIKPGSAYRDDLTIHLPSHLLPIVTRYNNFPFIIRRRYFCELVLNLNTRVHKNQLERRRQLQCQ